jgi:hypothetical protein
MQADVERLLARLLTDGELRERFVADPARVAIAAGLSAEEAASIARIPMRDLRVAGRGFDHKRKAKRKGVRSTWFAGWFPPRRS